MTTSPDQVRPLAGIRVLDATRVLAGPYCAYLLGLLGATVTRVERAPGGDSIRWRSRANQELGAQGLSTDYIAQACNKELILLDLKQPAATARFLEIVARHDVLVENFRTGALDRLGITEEAVRNRNPGLLWCSITGYGRAGPRREYPAYDSIIQAASGLMQLTGTPGSGPIKAGAPIIDYATGLNAALGVVSAIVMNLREPKGRRVSVSMLDTALAMMHSTASGFMNGRESLAPRGNVASSGALLSRSYATLDGQVCIAVNEPHQLSGLLRTLGIEEAAPEKLLSQVQERIATKRKADLDLALNTAGVPCSPVQGLDVALATAREADADFVQQRKEGSGRTYMTLPFSIDGERGAIVQEPEAIKR
ncbi:CaiB/BaiF CoA transferase family protein [Bordetella sp. H567]|uniref:CaiB/BaiF CoA transferase family protein n=1 Tax=Bordetella sp. H567 TaxID=1697043 RepID=UPI0009761894|nr:CoA transferase [Bordetella sp. H567]